MPQDPEKSKQLAYLVRSFEASCKIEHPTPQETNFRVALMKRLGIEFGLRELRDISISGPAADSAPTSRRS